MTLRAAQRLHDIAIRLQIYVEGVKANQNAEFHGVALQLNKEFKKLLVQVNYASLDGLSKAELNRLVVSLRNVQRTVYSRYTEKLLKQLQDFMQASLSVNRMAYASAYMGYKQNDDDNDYLPTDEQASKFIEEESKQLGFLPLFGLAAVLVGSSRLWPTINSNPIAANGVLLKPFITSFAVSGSLSLENLIRKGYSNGWTPAQTISEAAKQLEKIVVQNDAIVSTAMQHIESTVTSAVASALFKKYRWVSVIDSGTTQVCLMRNGRVYVFGDGPVPPAHIRCRSIVIPYDPKHDNETFFAWLKRQSNLTQNFALGNKQGAALRNGTLKAKDVKLSNPTQLTIDQFRKAGVQIITGNPP